VEAGNLEEEGFEFEIVGVGGAGRAILAETGDGLFELVASGAEFGGQSEFFGGGDDGDLMGAESVGTGAAGGFAGGTGALEPLGGGAAGIAVVVDEGMLGGEAAFGLVELSGPGGGGQEEFQQGGFTILVEVGGWIGDGAGKGFAEVGGVDLVSGPGGGEDDAIGSGKLVEEGGGGGCGVEEGDGPLEGIEEGLEIGSGEVRTPEVESGFATVVGAVAEEDEEEGFGGGDRDGLEGGAELVEVVGLGGIQADDG
jgi:hypothetical protein